MDLLIYFLLGLLVVTNCFWVTVCFRLIGRVTSKDYAEYVQADKLRRAKSQPKLHEVDIDGGFDEDAIRQADELNSRMGIG